MFSKYTKNILFCVNGHGLGNATRTQAVINELNKNLDKFNIAILATDLAVDFFKSESPEHKLIAYSSHFRKNKKPQSFLKDIYYLQNLINELSHELNIDIIITNSIYPLKRPKKVKVFALNNSHSGWKYIHKALLNFSLGSYLIELCDFIYHQLIPDKTLFIDLNCTSPLGNLIPPISRKARTKVVENKILILPGGGNDFDESFLKNLPQNNQYVIYRSLKSDFALNIEQRPSSYRIFEELSSFKLIICSGGLSSLSEVLHSGRPAIIIPQGGHHEQYMNAYHLSKNSKMFRLITHNEFINLPTVIDELTSLPCHKTMPKNRNSGTATVLEEIFAV